MIVQQPSVASPIIRCLVALLPGCPVARLPDCPVARLPHCLVAPLPRCPAAPLPIAIAIEGHRKHSKLGENKRKKKIKNIAM